VDTTKLIARAKAILLTPKTEWPVIAAEPATIGSIYTDYVVIMAAIPALVHFLGSTLIGVSVPFLGTYRVGFGAGAATAVLTYVLSLVSVFVVAFVVDALAPSFSAQKNLVQAAKTVAYAYTAGWVASIIGVVPGLGIISALVGLGYGIYLINAGLPSTMKCPPEKSVGYTVVTIIVAIVASIIVNWVIGMAAFGGLGAARMGMGPRFSHSHDEAAAEVAAATAAGAAAGAFAKGSNGEALQNWANNMEKASKQAESAQKSGDAAAQANAVGQMLGAALGGGGKVESLAPDRIKSFVPDSLGGLKRTEVSAERNAAMGVQISKATATYSDGADHRLNLEISDTGSLKGLVGFATGWAGVEQDKETDSGYEKTYKSNGQLIHEKWDKQSNSGEYSVVVGDRFTIQVSGNASSIDDLKRAAAGVNASGLAALKSEGVQSN
jgi:hypothetical protein